MKNTTLNDFVFGDAQSKKMLQLILANHIAFPDANKGKNGIILYGVFGSGKSTLAPLLCEWLEKVKTNSQLNAQPHKCDVSSSTSARTIDTIVSASSVLSYNNSGLHYFILDEADNMNDQAQRNLKALMSTRKDCVFILMTNYLNNIDQGIQSRSFAINMNAAHPQQYVSPLRKIAKDEYNANLSNAVLLKAATAGQGAWRDMRTAVEVAAHKHNHAVIDLDNYDYPVSVSKGV